MQNSIDEKSRVWLRTNKGEHISLVDPKLEQIHSEDIAHALGNLCRFGGHSKKFYSCASRANLLSTLIRKDPENKDQAKLALAALLYDAHDAYLFPIPWTASQAIRSKDHEQNKIKFRNLIYDGAGIQPTEMNLEKISRTSKNLLKLEMKELLDFVPAEFEKYDDLDIELRFHSPAESRQKFEERLAKLRKILGHSSNF